MTPLRTSKCREWAKQLAVWLGIATLLPLGAYYGTAAFSPPPDAEEFARVQARLNEELAAAPPADKDRLRAQIDQGQKQNTEAQRHFVSRMFWVGYPLGLAAFAIGLLVPVQTVGSGLMFGGIATLADACYTSWDALGRWIRFGSLAFALLAILALGLWRFRPPPADDVRLRTRALD